MPISKILPTNSIQEHRQNCKPKMQEMEKDMGMVHEYRCNRRVVYDRRYYETRDFFSSFGKTPQYQKYINFSPFFDIGIFLDVLRENQHRIITISK